MARDESLDDLYARYVRLYGRFGFDKLHSLAQGYVQAGFASILEVAAIGLAFDVVFSETRISASKISRLMALAWNQAYPSRPIETLDRRSPESVRIITHSWKSRLFASEVTRRLNEGEWIGHLRLESGQRIDAVFPRPRNSWTLQITGTGKSRTSPIQNEAVALINRIHSVLQRYPEQPILVSEQSVDNTVTGLVPLEENNLISALDKIASITLLEEAARVLGKRKTSLAGPLLESFSVELAQCVVPAYSGNPEKKEQKPGREYTSSPPSLLMTMDVSRSLREHYPCPDLPKETTGIVPKSVLAMVPDNPETISRAVPEIETRVLKDWVIQAITRQPSEITTEALRQHLSSLQRIKAERLIHRAFRDNEWLDRILTGYSPKDLQAMLDDNMQQTLLLIEECNSKVEMQPNENRIGKPMLVWNAKR